MSKIGIFSGTFDPVHTGHVAFALEAMQTLGLSEVVFLPELSPREKNPTPIQDRIKMLELSLAHHDGLSVMILKTPRFNVAETLPEIQDIFKDEQLVMLLGSDVVNTFKYRWPGLDDLYRSTELAIGLRHEDSKREITALLEASIKELGVEPTFHILPSPKASLASTQVRQGTHTIEDIHPDVATYITQHGLYLT